MELKYYWFSSLILIAFFLLFYVIASIILLLYFEYIAIYLPTAFAEILIAFCLAVSLFLIYKKKKTGLYLATALTVFILLIGLLLFFPPNGLGVVLTSLLPTPAITTIMETLFAHPKEIKFTFISLAQWGSIILPLALLAILWKSKPVFEAKQ